MKIIACGCSFMTLDKSLPGSHLTELVAKHFNAELENYAKLGASNFAIRLQIEHAIKQKPDAILIGFTSVDRIEIPKRSYSINDGILNIEYDERHIIPSFYNQSKVTTVSNVISNYEQTTELKSWIGGMYDSELKRQSDYFIASGVLDKLQKLKIPFVFTRGGLTGPNWDEWRDNEVDYKNGCPWLYVSGHALYHTTTDTQKELSTEWIDLLQLRINKV